jgi:hypothetical protein
VQSSGLQPGMREEMQGWLQVIRCESYILRYRPGLHFSKPPISPTLRLLAAWDEGQRLFQRETEVACRSSSLTTMKFRLLWHASLAGVICTQSRLALESLQPVISLGTFIRSDYANDI